MSSNANPYMRLFNLHPDLVAVGWVVGQLADSVKPVIPGLTGSFFVKSTYRMQPEAAPVPWPEKPLAAAGDKPIDGDIINGLAYASDFVPYKPRADFALIGTAHPPPGRVAGVFTASATVDALRKEVAVFGPRKWVPLISKLTEQTYRKKQYGGLRKIPQANRLKDFEKENSRLKRLLDDAELGSGVSKGRTTTQLRDKSCSWPVIARPQPRTSACKVMGQRQTRHFPDDEPRKIETDRKAGLLEGKILT